MIKRTLTMADLMKEQTEVVALRRGQVVEGIVAEIKKKAIWVDIGAKTEGVVTGRELQAVSDFVKHLRVGDKVKVEVKVPDSDRGLILLSLRKAATEFGWQLLQERFKTKQPIEVTGKELAQGGVVVVAPFGLLGFIPGSQIGSKYKDNPGALVGKTIKVQVLEVNPEKNRLVLSERLVSEPQKVEAEQKVIKRLRVGQKFTGQVSRVEHFGLFVRVKVDKVELEGLVHISEVSWERVEDLPRLYKVGQKVTVQLLSKENGRLQFSIKRLTPDPWADIEKKYPPDGEFEGEVVKTTNFGALVRLEPGIEGLVHISKIPPEVKLKVGQKVRCWIDKLDTQARRLSLGLVLTKKNLIYK